MPILAMDKNGRIYQTSRDRADGLGYGYSPECGEESDVTLGAAYLKSQDRRRGELLKEKQLREQERIADARRAHENEIAMRGYRRREKAEEKLLENPIIQANLLRAAVMQGCECQNRTAVSGNGFSANGRTGWEGMNRDQQAIHHAVTGQGRNTAFGVDPMEAQQAQMRKDAALILARKGR